MCGCYGQINRHLLSYGYGARIIMSKLEDPTSCANGVIRDRKYGTIIRLYGNNTIAILLASSKLLLA